MRTFYLLLLCFHCLFAVAHKSSQKLQKQQEQSSSFVTDVEAELKKMFHQVIIEAAKSKQSSFNLLGIPILSNSASNGTGLQELLTDADFTPCMQRNSFGGCVRGTLMINSWLDLALYTQRSFVSNLTLDQVQFIATQSSYLTQSDGFDTTWPVPRFAQWFADLGLTLDPMQHRVYGTLFEEAIDWTFAWAQQAFSLTDQFLMGVRWMELEPVFIDGEIFLCRSNKIFGLWACDSGSNRLLADALTEIKAILDMNTQDVVVLQVNYYGSWAIPDDSISLLESVFTSTFGKRLYSPQSELPSMLEMTSTGQPILPIWNAGKSSNVFWNIPSPEKWLTDFTPYPACGGSKAAFNFTRYAGDSQTVAIIYNGPSEYGLITHENLGDLMSCGVTPQLDWISPKVLEHAVWSWKSGEPSATGCVAMIAGQQHKGRWMVRDCNEDLPVACQNTAGNVWTTSYPNKASWSRASSLCGRGSVFSFPLNGYQNQLLYAAEMASNCSTSTTPCYFWLNYQNNL